MTRRSSECSKNLVMGSYSAMNIAIEVMPITSEEAYRLVNTEFRIPKDMDWMSKFRIAFGDETKDDPSKFIPIPTRSYFLVLNNKRKEALISINFRLEERPPKANISSVSRLFRREYDDITVAKGWQYLEALIESILIPRQVGLMLALLMSEDGLDAFADLKDVSEETNKPYNVAVITDSNPGWASALVRIYNANRC